MLLCSSVPLKLWCVSCGPNASKCLRQKQTCNNERVVLTKKQFLVLHKKYIYLSTELQKYEYIVNAYGADILGYDEHE